MSSPCGLPSPTSTTISIEGDSTWSECPSRPAINREVSLELVLLVSKVPLLPTTLGYVHSWSFPSQITASYTSWNLPCHPHLADPKHLLSLCPQA